ncbi:MAG: Peptidase family [Pseudomonadota bacterium]
MDIKGHMTNVVMIQHKDRVVSRYLHIEQVRVKRGDEAKKGQQIAAIGLNGPGGPNTSARVSYPHLHLEIYRQDSLIDPLRLGFACGAGDWRWPIGCAGE